jgi:anti-sigma B factor antagonist
MVNLDADTMYAASFVESRFQTDGHDQGKVHVIAVSGELDLAVASSFRAELTEAIESGAEEIVIDLKDLQFIDSTGLGALVNAHQDAASAGCTLGLINPGPQVTRLLELTGLADRLLLAPGD